MKTINELFIERSDQPPLPLTVVEHDGSTWNFMGVHQGKWHLRQFKRIRGRGRAALQQYKDESKSYQDCSPA